MLFINKVAEKIWNGSKLVNRNCENEYVYRVCNTNLSGPRSYWNRITLWIPLWIPQNGKQKATESREKRQISASSNQCRRQMIKMLLLFTLMSSFQMLIVTTNEIPSSDDKTLVNSTKKILVRVVGGEITDIRNYPFLVGEMRPWRFLNII